MPHNVALYLSLTQMHHQGIANGALRYANAKGWRIFGAYWPMYEIRTIDAWNGDGIIAAVESAGELRKLRRAGLPIVDISGAVERDDLTRVSNDNAAIGRLAGDHIVRLGYDRYCFAAAAGSLWSDDRLRGFQDATAPPTGTATSLSSNGKSAGGSRRNFPPNWRVFSAGKSRPSPSWPPTTSSA